MGAVEQQLDSHMLTSIMCAYPHLLAKCFPLAAVATVVSPNNSHATETQLKPLGSLLRGQRPQVLWSVKDFRRGQSNLNTYCYACLCGKGCVAKIPALTPTQWAVESHTAAGAVTEGYCWVGSAWR